MLRLDKFGSEVSILFLLQNSKISFIDPSSKKLNILNLMQGLLDLGSNVHNGLLGMHDKFEDERMSRKVFSEV